MGLKERLSPSDRMWQGAQSPQGFTELCPPGPVLRKVQSEAACRACETSDKREEASSESLCGHHLLSQTDARRPAGDVVGQNLHGHPGCIGCEATRWQVVQSHTVLQVAYGVLDLGVSAVIGFQLESVALSVGDEAVIAVAGKQRQLGTGRGPDPADDQSRRRCVRLTSEGSVGRLGNVGCTLHPVGYGRPVRLGYVLYEIAQAPMLSDGDGEAYIVVAAYADDVASIEAAVSPYRERSRGSCLACLAQRLTQEVGCAPDGVGSALAQSCHQHVSCSCGDGQQRVIAPLTGVVVMANSLLCQSVGLADGGVQVDRQGRVTGSCPCVPGTRQQLPAHPIEIELSRTWLLLCSDNVRLSVQRFCPFV